MSKWRELAIRLFPEYRRLYQEPETTVYWVLSDQLREALNYHERDDSERLRPIYDFARWCWMQGQRDKELYGAVVTAFYEHLVDEPATLAAVSHWLEPEIFTDLLDVFAARLEEQPYERLVEEYNRARGTKLEPEWEKHRESYHSGVNG